MINFYGIDVIRAYEVSWLDGTGKPELALLEIFQDAGQASIDPWKLKKFLATIIDKTFADFKNIRSEIHTYLKTDPNFGDSYIKLTTQQDFYNIDFSKPTPSAELPHKITQDFRFVCQQTEQPFIGTASIYVENDRGTIREQFTKTLLAVRNEKFTPSSVMGELFNKRFTQLFNEDFVFTINLNRRGGISFQSLRCKKSLDFGAFIHREVLE
ncbi:MAG TPA: hypothetical protein VLG38_04655 [Gammaproteobacteria bacterium]|nr:hypothetical protein [Gammaproteobacteria bacterium]